MQISNQINQLINKLNELKPLLSDNTSLNKDKFNTILRASLEGAEPINPAARDFSDEKNLSEKNDIPSWVDSDYLYDPSNPRKPNLREMMEALSGKNVEELYDGRSDGWKDIKKLASEILYNVVGNYSDTRDWRKIMNSSDIIAEARLQTKEMFKPYIDIADETNQSGEIINQYAVLKDSNGTVIRNLDLEANEARKIIKNFGIEKDDVPADLKNRIFVKHFDPSILALLTDLETQETLEKKRETSKDLTAISQKTLTDNANSQKRFHEIPEDELAKL